MRDTHKDPCFLLGIGRQQSLDIPRAGEGPVSLCHGGQGYLSAAVQGRQCPSACRTEPASPCHSAPELPFALGAAGLHCH